MPNVMKYGNVDWPEDSPVSGERLATAGEYTGQHKGTPMMDALEGADNEPYLRARETVRYGTLTPDAGDPDFPDMLITVSYSATGSITDISLAGVVYDPENGVFDGVPDGTESFTFKDGGTAKTATNTDGIWTVT